MWVKLQQVLYNLDHIVSIMPVDHHHKSLTICEFWEITLVFLDGSHEDIKYEQKEDALTDYDKIERTLNAKNHRTIGGFIK